MWAVVGLGNPGPSYRETRHNLGAMAVAGWARELGRSLRPGNGPFEWTEVRHAGTTLFLAVPTTYMNLSGRAVRDIQRKAGLETSEILVVVDDFQLPLGRTRLRPRGSDGGHRGLQSIIATLGSDDFPRLRLGIGEPPADVETSDWVLEPFTEEEHPAVGQMIERAADTFRVLAREGLARAMNVANRPPEPVGDDGGERN